MENVLVNGNTSKFLHKNIYRIKPWSELSLGRIGCRVGNLKKYLSGCIYVDIFTNPGID